MTDMDPIGPDDLDECSECSNMSPCCGKGMVEPEVHAAVVAERDEARAQLKVMEDALRDECRLAGERRERLQGLLDDARNELDALRAPGVGKEGAK